MMITAGIAFLAACAAGFLLTALARRIAPRLGLTDRPDGHRKLHGRDTPFGGGVSIFLATAGTLGALLVLPNPWRADLWNASGELLGLLLAGAVIVIVGLLDDRVGLRGRQKALGQIAAASILMLSGFMIQRVAILGWQIELGLLAVPFTLFWLLGAINAVNLLDGVDGLATTVGLILVSAIAVMAVISGRQPEVAMIALVFAGGLLGFLRLNFPPARIFLGDSGSMLIGLVVGALAIHGALKGPGTVLLAAPLAIWTIPVFDTAAAILRRRLTGRSIYATDHGHLHHRLLGRLGSNRKVLAAVTVACLLTSAAALAGVFLKNDLVALVSCGAIVGIFIATDLFGRTEVMLLADRLGKAGMCFAQFGAARRPRVRQSMVRLEGSRHWDPLWAALTESADKLCLQELRFELSVPAIGEQYSATWEQQHRYNSELCWEATIPLVLADEPVGRLTIVGQGDGESGCESIERLLSLVEPFESRLQDLTRQEAADSAMQRGDGRHAEMPDKAEETLLLRTCPPEEEVSAINEAVGSKPKGGNGR